MIGGRIRERALLVRRRGGKRRRKRLDLVVERRGGAEVLVVVKTVQALNRPRCPRPRPRQLELELEPLLLVVARQGRQIPPSCRANKSPSLADLTYPHDLLHPRRLQLLGVVHPNKSASSPAKPVPAPAPAPVNGWT